jgi:2-methylcitrate dehydratase
LTERVDDLPGFVSRPMQRADVEEKFERIAKSVVSASQIGRIAQIVWDLERAESVRGLIDSLVIPG